MYQAIQCIFDNLFKNALFESNIKILTKTMLKLRKSFHFKAVSYCNVLGCKDVDMNTDKLILKTFWTCLILVNIFGNLFGRIYTYILVAIQIFIYKKVTL